MTPKTLLIIGYGLEGRSAYEYFRKDFEKVIILDESDHPKFDLPDGVEFVSAKVDDYNFAGVDMIFRTPAVDPRRIKADGQQIWDESTRQSVDGMPKIWSSVNEFFSVCPTKHIIGVTGTKGKGTTATLIFQMLTKSGVKAHLGGNIGVPVLDLLSKISPDDVVVLELSSFQLWDFVGAPEVAVMLKVEPEHLDVHTNYEDYKKAKSNLFKNMNDGLLVYYPEGQDVPSLVAASKLPKLPYLMSDNPESCVVNDDKFTIEGQPICSTSNMKLIGRHNYENICAAVTSTWFYSQNILAIQGIIKSYRGQPYRMQDIGTISTPSITFYNDAISGVPTAAIAAMHAVDGPKIMLMGGKDRGIDLEPMVAEAGEAGVVGVVLTGETAVALEKMFIAKGYSPESILNLGMVRMDVVVPESIRLAKSLNAISIILSAGCSSFDLYRDYTDRGDQFDKAVRSILERSIIE